MRISARTSVFVTVAIFAFVCAVAATIAHPGSSVARENRVESSTSKAPAQTPKGDARSPDGEFEYNEIELANDLFITDMLYNRVRLKEVEENVSMGLTSDGLNFRVGW